MLTTILVQARDFAHDVLALGPIPAIHGIRSRWGTGGLLVRVPDIGFVQIRRSNSDYKTLRQIFVLKEYRAKYWPVEQGLKARYQAILSAGLVPVIIDAGANIGLATLWFARLFPEAHIVSIEPDKSNFEIMVANVSKMARVSTRMAGLSATAGQASIKNTDGEGWSSRTDRSSAGPVPLITVGDVLSSVENSAPFIVKIDIEGFEADLFSDNCEWLSDICTVSIEPHDWLFPRERTSASFQRAFGERDFSLFINGGNLIYLNNKFI